MSEKSCVAWSITSTKLSLYFYWHSNSKPTTTLLGTLCQQSHFFQWFTWSWARLPNQIWTKFNAGFTNKLPHFPELNFDCQKSNDGHIDIFVNQPVDFTSLLNKYDLTKANNADVSYWSSYPVDIVPNDCDRTLYQLATNNCIYFKTY